jgi:SAM-dependent methyltransferase
MSGSIDFDQAAEIYDATRTLPATILEAAIKMLSAELRGRGTCLEIGVGTGRIAIPLVEAGIPVAGIDLSTGMLSKLAEKTSGVPALVADATQLPFKDDSLGAGLAVHVLHLIPNWRAALGELTRVVGRGGVILIDIGGGFGFLRDIEDYFTRTAGVGKPRPGVTDPDELDSEMARLGAEVRDLPPIVEKQLVVPSAWIQSMEANIFSCTWSLDEETRLKAADETREWAKEQFGDLHKPLPLDLEIRYRAYDLP